MSTRTLATAVALAMTTCLGSTCGGAAAETYAADSVHSSIVFRVKHMDTSYAWGRFNAIAGSFSLDEADPSAGQFEFRVESASIDTGNAQRDGHLKGPDFFNAVQFPAITFKSKSIGSQSAGAYEVNGDLTLHGVTKPVTAKVVATGKAKNQKGTPIAGIEATLGIKRSDFGMNKMVGPIGDDVRVTVSIEGVKK